MNKEDIIDGAMYQLLGTPEHKLDTWAKHNMLIAHIYNDGSIRFKDTYWMSGEYTYMYEDVCDRIEFMFDLNCAKEVSKREWMEYNMADKTHVPVGGTGERWIVYNHAEKSRDLVIHALESDISDTVKDIEHKQRDLSWKRTELSKLINNNPENLK